MLEIKNICKSYKTAGIETKALDNISIAFRDSEFVAILGPSGSGKTTCLNVIGGLDHYDSGDLLINGKSTKNYKDKDWDFYRNNEIGFVFQNYNLIQHQSILSNVELALTLSGISISERKEKAKKALEDVGLKDHIDKKPNQLSGGQMQRVAIARALVNNPSIVFADEPTGALDTKTSISIMEILKKISKDKLVVMVTHNPEIANDYATRIVKLKDAKIVDDSRPFNIKEEKIKSKVFSKKTKKNHTSMSFLTALSLSFANLLGKKGRTFMTAFAGSIGIIGIAAILSLSTGTRQYIDNVEKNTLAQYPLSISRSKSVMASMNDSSRGGSLSNMIQMMQHNQQENNTIGIRSFVSMMLNSSGANDLKSFKSYLEQNPENFDKYVSSVEYKYNTSPLIYANDNYGQREVFPSSTLSSSSNSISSSSNNSGVNNGVSGPMAEMSSTSSFFPLPEQESIYKDNYTILEGRWPENYNECVLVLHQDGSINDTLLYTLGLRDHKELENAYKQFLNNDKAQIPDEYDDIKYSQVLGHSFKIVNPSDTYSYNSESNIWENKSLDAQFMKPIVDSAENLTIVGIVNPPQGSGNSLSLTAGINYLSALNNICIDKAKSSQIVQDQLNRQDIDVLTGRTFASEKESAYDPSFFSSLVKINTDAIQNLISVDTSAFGFLKNTDNIGISQDDIINIINNSITKEIIEKLIKDLATDQTYSKDIEKIITDACDSYLEYSKIHPEVTPQIYFSQDNPGYLFIEAACVKAGIDFSPIIVSNITDICKKVFTEFGSVMTEAVQSYMLKLQSGFSNMQNAVTFNKDALKDVFQFDLSEEKLLEFSKIISGKANRTFEINLSNFGYADLTNPLSITIYPKDFDSKEIITKIIDNYNNSLENSGHKEKTVSFTDFAKLLMSSLRTMIDMITAVLIAFVAISLVVSSIMIGIITYISVLERTKEIGILRAIGARKKDIFNVFNAETFIVGIIAGVIGIGITAILCVPANIIAKRFFDVQYDIAILPIWAIFALILISVLLTFIAGLIPSRSASKKDPVTAINS